MVGNLAIQKQDVYLVDEVDTIKDELKWCSISLSEVIGVGKRLEATVFDIDGKHARNIIANCKWEKFFLSGSDSLLENAYYPGRFKRIYSDSSNGVPFYTPSQMSELYPRPEKYISRLTNCNLDELKLKFGDILLTRSGTIGNLTVVSRTLENKVFSDDVIRITCKNSTDIGFLYVYLKSKIGNKILQTNNYGSVISHIEPEHLAEIPVPYPPEPIRKKINDLVMRSFTLRDDSNDLIEQATNMLIKELCLPPISEFKTEKYDNSASVDNFFVKLSEMNGRADASYHVPIVKAIIKHLQTTAKEVTTISDSRISKTVILPGRFKRVYVEEGYGVVFFSGKNIMELNPSDKKYLSFSQHNKKIKNELTIKENMILVTCSGTVGKVALVPKHWDNWAMTHDIIRLVPADDIQGYTYIWLQSAYASKLLQAYSYGSVVSHIEKPHIEDMKIPLLKDKSVQKKINDFALEANAKRYEAYILEQQAIQIMNDEVIYNNG